MNYVYDSVINSAKMYELALGVLALPHALEDPKDWRQGLSVHCSNFCGKQDQNYTIHSKEAHGFVHDLTTFCPKAIHELKVF